MTTPERLTTERRVFRLLWRSRNIELRAGVALIGRSTNCAVVIDRPAVSRNHARLYVEGDTLTVEDIGSANGVYVNGERVVDPTPLGDGDRLLLGSEELVVAVSVVDEEPEEFGLPVSTGDLLVGADLVAVGLPADPPLDDSTHGRMVTTQKLDAFQALGRVADRMLVAGKYDAAIRVLAGHMRGVLEGVRAGDRIEEPIVAGSTQYAMKLAMAKLDGAWIDFVIEVHYRLKKVLPNDVVRQIAALVGQGVKVDRKLFLTYKTALRAAYGTLSVEEQQHCGEVMSLSLDVP
jgi:hypothetical protein